ncbi:MAG: hypothetical protein NTY00_10775 [Deltaproteobacteria bacterium]|nr:hypothetical protein [Deltaproteobacteria bacterium]
MSSTGNGYFMDSYKGSGELFKYLWSISARIPITGSEMEVLKIRKLYHKFIVHLYVSTCLKSIKNRDFETHITVPIYSGLIWGKLKRSVATQYLRELNIIRFTNHYHSNNGNGKCREYRLHVKIFNKAQSIAVRNIKQEWDSLIEGFKYPQKVNLFTGRPVTTSLKHKMSTCYNNKPDFEIPELIKESIKSLLPCPFNPHDIMPWLERAKEKFKHVQKEYIKVKDQFKQKFPNMSYKEKRKHPKYYPTYRKYNKAKGLLINMNLAFNTIMNQNPELIDKYTNDGKQLMQYKAAYSPQGSGRVTEIHGGFQGITTPCKLLLLNEADTFNYDLKNSQAMILADELKEGGIQCDWLNDYIAGKIDKEKLAEEVGITVECWKECFYSTIMGAETGPYGAIFNNIHNEIEDYRQAKKIHKKFLMIIKEMLVACNKWRDYLLYSVSQRYMYKHNNYHWRNVCNMRFKGYAATKDNDNVEIVETDNGEVIKNLKTLGKLKRELAAFFLQGREAFFIHSLTIACAKHDIPVYKNEHDGVITGKKIPIELVRKISNEVGLPQLDLTIKPICSVNKKDLFEKFLCNIE